MDIDVQEFSSFGGFADDDEYSNLFGIRGKKYYAKKRQEQAQQTAQAAAASAQEQKINAQKLAEAAKAQEAEAKAILKEQEAKLEQAMAQRKVEQITGVPSESPLKNKKLLIGAGIAVAIIVGLVVVLRK